MENRYIIGDASSRLDDVENETIKMIYIDPPYNTCNKFIYEDKKTSEEWVEFMEGKIQKAFSKLKADGVIFISIDDNELINLRIICDKVFGKDNFLGTMITRQATRSNSKHINTIHEYVLAYSKNKKKLKKLEVKRIDIPLYRDKILEICKEIKSLNKEFGKKKAEKKLKEIINSYRHIDGFSWIRNYNLVDEHGDICFAVDISTPTNPQRLEVPEINLILEPLKTRGWPTKEKILSLHNEDRLIYKSNRPYKKKYLYEATDSLMSILNFYSRQGNHDLEKLGIKGVFDNPKPVNMIKLFILASCENDDIILDFFSGSATTGQAVLEVNREKNMNLRFILIQKSEKITNEKIAKLLKENHLEVDLASIGILRLHKVSDRFPNEKFKVIT